jgi:hypothetical protein
MLQIDYPSSFREVETRSDLIVDDPCEGEGPPIAAHLLARLRIYVVALVRRAAPLDPRQHTTQLK